MQWEAAESMSKISFVLNAMYMMQSHFWRGIESGFPGYSSSGALAKHAKGAADHD